MARLRPRLVVSVAVTLPAGVLAGLLHGDGPGDPHVPVSAVEGGLRIGLVALVSVALAVFFLRRWRSPSAALAAAAGVSFFPSCVDVVAAPDTGPGTWAAAVAAVVLALLSFLAPAGVSGGAAVVAVVAGLVHGLMAAGGGAVAALHPSLPMALGAGLLAGATAERIVHRSEAGSVRRRLAGGALVLLLAAGALGGLERAASWSSPVAFWTRAVAEQSQSPVPRAMLAAALHGAGEAEAAGESLGAFSRAVEAGGGRLVRSPSLRLAAVKAAVETALARMKEGPEGTPAGEARAVAAACAALVPGSPDAALLTGEGLLREGEAVKAVDVLRRAAVTAGADAAVYEALARALLATGDHPGALEAANTAIGLRPGEARWAITLGEALLATGRSAEALRLLRRTLDTGERDPRVVRAYGDAHLRLARSRLAASGGGKGRARRFLLAGLQEDRDNAALKAELERLDGQRREESLRMEALLRPDARGDVHPNNVMLYAIWLCQWGDFEAAGPVFAKLLEGRESNAQIHFYYGSEFCEGRETMEGYEAAVRAYRKALAIDDSHVDALNRLWQCLRILGRPEDAAVEARRFVDLAPDHPDAVEAERFLERPGGPPR